MSLLDTALNLVTKKAKDPEAPKPASGSRSEREAKIKDKAGLVINIFALLLAVNAYIGGTLSSTIMNNTIKANDIWNFYQAKSIKQTMYIVGAAQTKDPIQQQKFIQKANSYDEGAESKTELYTAAKKLESERDNAKKRSPWISYASTAYQLSIVVLSASILSVSMYLFWGSFVVAGIGLLLMIQGLFLIV